MSDTRHLLDRIAAIRQRLGQAQGMLFEVHSEAADLAQNGELDRHTEAAARIDQIIDQSLRQLIGTPALDIRIPDLTHRARTTLRRCQELVSRLRTIGNGPALDQAAASSPLVAAHQQFIAMASVCIRTAQSMPDSAGEQMRLCEGLDGLLDALADRIGGLQRAVAQFGRANERIATLAHLLTGLSSGSNLALESFTALAEAVVCDARQGEPLHILEAGNLSPAADHTTAKEWIARFVACHSLNVAAVLARMAHQYAHCEHERLASVTAALVYDVGMLAVPLEILAQPSVLTATQQRRIEQHVAHGADLVARHLIGGQGLVDAISQHHERSDGTGYPTGTRNIDPSAHPLAAADMYAAMIASRPHRPATDTKTALSEILLAAERGRVDKNAAQALTRLSFYPVGTLVELNDKSLARVLAVHVGDQGLHALARPVVGIQLGGNGLPVSDRTILDLAGDETHSIIRGIPVHERNRLAARHWQLI